MSVRILEYTNKYPLSLIGEAAGICWGSNVSDDDRNIQRAIDCINNGHERVAEFGDVYMVLEGYSARTIRELYTHIGGMPTRLQASTRYINYKDFDYITHPHFNENQNEIYKEAMEKSISYYKKLLDAGVAKEDAANILPLGMQTTIVYRINARALFTMSHQRECKRAYWEYRDGIMKDIKEALSNYSPQWKCIVDTWFQPKCKYLGYCPEKNGCNSIK